MPREWRKRTLGRSCIIVLFLALIRTSVFAQEVDVGRIFSKLYPRLEQGLHLVDEQKKLPESAWFGQDKASKQQEIDRLLDSAIGALEIPELRKHRAAIAEAEGQIQESLKRIAEYQRARLTAPSKSVLGLNQVPLFTTKKGYDEKIEREHERIEGLGKIIDEAQREFLGRLRGLGIELSSEQFEVLLSTVNGNDYLELALAFETVKGITEQLQKLTKESGEDVRTARRYYGMYTVLLRLLDYMQRKFVRAIDETHIPKLGEFERAARRNIEEAERAIVAGGEQLILEQNIESNELTLKALSLYRSYLETQRAQIEKRNSELRRQILTADNTYNTVLLASEVVRLLQSGIKNVQTLSRLQPPDLTGFENRELKEEFAKLTGLMRTQK